MSNNPPKNMIERFIEKTKFRFEMSQYIHSVFPNEFYISEFDKIAPYLIMCLPMPTYFVLKPLISSRLMRIGVSFYLAGGFFMYNGLYRTHTQFYTFVGHNKDNNILAEYINENWDEFKTEDKGPNEKGKGSNQPAK